MIDPSLACTDSLIQRLSAVLLGNPETYTMDSSDNRACNASGKGGYNPTLSRNSKRSLENFNFTSHEQDQPKRLEVYSETQSHAIQLAERACEDMRNLIRAELQKCTLNHQIPPQT